MHLPESSSRLGSTFIGILFICSIYSQWTFTRIGLAFYWPMDMDPSSPSYKVRRASFLSSSTCDSSFYHIWWFLFFFFSHIWQFHLTLCNSNITFDSFFVIFNGSLILFFLHLTISSSHFIIPTSHIVVFLSYLVIFLFLFLRLTVPSSHCIALTPYLTVFLSNLVVFFFFLQLTNPYQRRRFHTVQADTAGIYRTSVHTGTKTWVFRAS